MNKMYVFLVVLMFCIDLRLSQFIPIKNEEDSKLPVRDSIYSRLQLLLWNSMTADSIQTWPGGVVPYRIDTSFDEEDQEIIQEAIKEIADQSCVQFVERTTEGDYVYIRNLPSGCSAHIGYQEGRQSLILSDRECMTKGKIIHELLHVLGFIHEHCRSDRDDYIDIDEDNIAEGKKTDFERNDHSNNLGEEYDYNSIMHYGSYTMAKDPSKPVIIPKDPSAVIGQRVGLSEIDVRKLNKLYECNNAF